MTPSPRRRALPVVVDDTDPGLVYKGQWSRQTPSPGQFNNTVTGTIQVGATISYTFKGEYVQVFGQQLPHGVVNSTYTVDGKNTVTYVNKNAVNKKQHQVQFFSSPTLKDGKHTLVITNHGEYLNFDYLQVVVDGTGTVGQSPSSHSPFTVSSTTSASKARSSNTASGVPNVGSAEHSSGGMAVGTEAAIVILSVFLFSALLGIAVFIFWRTCARRRSKGLVTPFAASPVAPAQGDVLGARKADLLGRDPFRRASPPVSVPRENSGVREDASVTGTLFHYDSESEDQHQHDTVDAPRRVLLTSAFRRVPQPERVVSIISMPVNIAGGPSPQRERADVQWLVSSDAPAQWRTNRAARE